MPESDPVTRTRRGSAPAVASGLALPVVVLPVVPDQRVALEITSGLR